MPSRINMGPDGGPYIAINENNGDIELEDNTGTTVAVWDDTNSQWDFQNNPISNVDTLTSNSVNTDDATVDTRTINKVDSYTQSSTTDSTVRVDFSGLSDNNYYVNFVSPVYTQNGTPKEIVVYINGDDAGGNGNYAYWDETGTKQAGEDNILLMSASGGFYRVAGGLILSLADVSSAGIQNNLTPQRIGNTESITQYGGWEGSNTPTSVQIDFENGLAGGQTVEIWEWYR